MNTIFSAAVMFLLLSGCSKSTSIAVKDYSGNFILTSQNNIPLTGRIHIQFTGVNFTGAGDSSILPYVGHGVFKVEGDSIYFTQTGMVPDLFGKSSILEGGFLLEQNSDSLVFHRNEIGSVATADVLYRLHKD